MSIRLSLFAGALAFAAPPFVSAAEAPEIHYAPTENLERVDVTLLRAARAKIELAAYVLTDWPIIDALIDACQSASKIDPRSAFKIDPLLA